MENNRETAVSCETIRNKKPWFAIYSRIYVSLSKIKEKNGTQTQVYFDFNCSICYV
jgi:hypothetical protein